MASPDVVPVVGQPIVFAIGFVVLLLVVFTGTWADSLVTVAHEGGHMIVAVLTGRGPDGFVVHETTGGGATRTDTSWGAGDILTTLAGYLTAPLLGLAGAHLVMRGLSWSLLWASLFLLAGAFFQARGLFTNLIVVLAGAGIGGVAVWGTPWLQTAVALGLVWLMLFGEFRGLWHLGFGRDPGSDAAALARHTLIPAIVWVALWWFVAIVCLWVGGRRLLGV